MTVWFYTFGIFVMRINEPNQEIYIFCDNLEYILPISIFQETEETQCLAEICPTLVA